MAFIYNPRPIRSHITWVPNSSEDRWQRQQKTTEVKQTELVGKNMVFKKDGSVIAQIPFIFKTKYKYDVYMYMYLFIHILKGYHIASLKPASEKDLISTSQMFKPSLFGFKETSSPSISIYPPTFEPGNRFSPTKALSVPLGSWSFWKVIGNATSGDMVNRPHSCGKIHPGVVMIDPNCGSVYWGLKKETPTLFG